MDTYGVCDSTVMAKKEFLLKLKGKVYATCVRSCLICVPLRL